jgi:ferritin-like metal-binding protein YciE
LVERRPVLAQPAWLALGLFFPALASRSGSPLFLGLCALEGIVEEAEEVIGEAKDPAVLDAGMIAAAQAVEHYEIARYGTLIAWAEQLGMDKASALLQETLKEEKHADEILNKIAMQSVNREAA